MSLNNIVLAMQAAFERLEISEPVVLSPPNRDGDADMQCNSIVRYCGRNKRSDAAALAQAVIKECGFREDDLEINVSGPGFLTLKFAPAFLVNAACEQMASTSFGVDQKGQGKTVIVDFGGPNVAKALHVGHLRSFVLGESLRRILMMTGHTVITDIHLGDWGLQMGKLLLGFEIVQGHLGNDHKHSWSLADLEEFYLVGSRVCTDGHDDHEYNLERARSLTFRLQSGDEQLHTLWQAMRAVSMAGIEVHIQTLGCHFDLYKGESDCHATVQVMLADLANNGHLISDNGSQLVCTDEGNDVLLLQTTTGSTLYAATDLATIIERVQMFSPDEIIYCVDQRQEQHFKSVFAAAQRFNMSGNASLVHAGFGTVKGKDGKPFKTREGGTVKLEELIERVTQSVRKRMSSTHEGDILKVAVGALKFADLQSDRIKGYVFDIDEMCAFEGCTGPYMQYACVRIASLLEKAGEFQPCVIPEAISEEERQTLLVMLKWPSAVERAAAELKPHHLVDHVFRLAQAFSRVYGNVPILGADDERTTLSRLSVCQLVLKQIKQGLHLLGIEVPRKM